MVLLLPKFAHEVEYRANVARAIVGFRNRITHGYDSVDDGIVWGGDADEASDVDAVATES